MAAGDREQPPGGREYPSLEDPHAFDYPPDAGLPPPVYPVPGATGYPGYPPVYHPGYYQNGYDPYRPIKPPGTNIKAIAALVTSLVGLMCCGLPSIAGLILGVIAMRETRRSGQDGFAIAMIAAVIGGLAVAGWVIYLLVSISIYASSWKWTP